MMKKLALLVADKVVTSYNGLNRILNYLVIIGVFGIIITVAVPSFMRYTMRAMPLGMEEAAVLVAGYTYFIAVALCTRDRKQITVNLFSLFHFSRRFVRITDIVVDVSSIIACGFFAYIAIEFAWVAHTAGFRLPPWDWDAIVQVICVAIGLSLATLYLLIHLVQRIWKYDKYRRYEPRVWEQLGM